MKPKGKLFALLAIFAAIGLVTATGAFTTVSAARTAEVNVAGDGAALLKIGPVSGSANSDTTPASGGNPYFQVSNGEATIDLSNVNLNAQTSLVDVFLIENQGTQTVTVWIETDGTDGNTGAIAFGVDPATLDGTPTGTIVVGNGYAGANPVRIDGADPSQVGVSLDPGESIVVGLFIDTSDNNPEDALTTGGSGVGNGEDIITSMTVNADADETAAYTRT